jgi:hypothetical protein
MRNDSKHPNTWGLAGGKCESGETLLDTIHRECWEELGLNFVNAKFLKSELQNFKKNYIYGHVLNCWPPDTTLNFLSGGSGYLMSNEILIPIMGEIPLLGTGLNDVTFGEFIRQNKINIQHDDRFNPQTPAVMKKKDINKNFTFHYVNTDNLMYELYLKCI